MRNSGKRQSLNQHSHTFVNFLRARLSQLFGRYQPMCVCVCVRALIWFFCKLFFGVMSYFFYIFGDERRVIRKRRKKFWQKTEPASAAHIKIRIVFFSTQIFDFYDFFSFGKDVIIHFIFLFFNSWRIWTDLDGGEIKFEVFFIRS